MIAAGVAGVGGSSGDAVVTALDAAVYAEGHASGEAFLFDVFKAGVICGELLVELADGVALFGPDGLVAVHSVLNLL
jgi:hypothetical protein